MPSNVELEHRLTTLEIQLKDTQEEVATLEEKIGQYDKLAARWGGAMMAALAIGAVMSFVTDSVRGKIEKLLGWLAS